MQNTSSNVLTELTIAKHRLAQVAQDPHILQNDYTLASRCLRALTGLDKQIMTFRVTKGRNKVHAKNKHKQAGG